MSRLSVADIPPELWLDDILPNLALSDILHLGCTNRFFYLLTSDEPFWHRKLQQDYNFSGSDTARATGWKFIYKRFRNPQVYVWGERGHGRLGLQSLPMYTGTLGVPSPTRLHIPGVQIVNIVAGGMSFHALDVDGNVYVWGVLDGTMPALHRDGFSVGGKGAGLPMRLALPVSIRTLSCGRLHTAALDSEYAVWTFTTWGRPFRMLLSLSAQFAEAIPIQVECGWSFTAVLTQSGDVWAYWPFGETMRTAIENKFHDLDAHDQFSKAIPEEDAPNVIPCYPWDLRTADVVSLRPIPYNLPDLPDTDLDEEMIRQETRLVKIAGMDNNLIGLTNKGHVLRYSRLSSEADSQRGDWEYLPYFSEAKKVAEDEVFSDQRESPLAAPETMHITHISAHFKTFVAYSAGPQAVVLMGQFSTEGDESTPIRREPLKPIIHRNLQYQSVISVVLGDYHYGALTATGKLFTWGAYSKGALGLGNPMDIPLGQPGGFLNEQHRRAFQGRGWLLATPPDVQEPTEVKFDYGQREREKFCFAATAAGWHMGALVINVDADDEGLDDASDDATSQPVLGSLTPQSPVPETPQYPAPIFHHGGLPYFRVGFAGRGAFRGRGGIGRAMDPH